MEKITKLIASKKNIADLLGIENLTNLTYLDLSSNQISNIESLKGLTNLKSVQILDYMEGLKLNFQVYNKADEIIKSIIKPEMSELEKAGHDYIVLHTIYKSDNYSTGTIPMITVTAYGVLMEGSGVCDSYEAATKLLLNKVCICCCHCRYLD